MAAIQLEFNDPQFWSKIRTATSGNNVGNFSTSAGTRFVTMNDTVKMVPFVRSRTELFETTARRVQASEGFKVVVNAQLYDVGYLGLMDAAVGSDPVSAGATTPTGRSILGGSVLGGTTASQHFYISNNTRVCPPYLFGFGAAPTSSDAAVGGAGPIIINGRPYASTNTYDSSVPSGAPAGGEPQAPYDQHMIYRGNRTFAALNALPPATGKIIIAYSRANAVLAVVIQPDALVSSPLNNFRNHLVRLGFHDAVFFDGSDSVMMMLDGRFVIRAGSNKNETNITGIGFKY